jgi:uncharacterized protein (DUF58 family)
MQIRSLELRAKSVVEGFFTGLHRSPYHGFSVEFTEYRQYVPGDDPRYLDWKLYARSDRYYVKRFEDETNLRCHLVLDHSRSMAFGSLGYSKSDYARTLAATLAYFLTTQRDAVGLIRFAEEIDQYIPARYRTGQFRRLVVALDTDPAGTSTGLVSSLEQTAARLTKRGLVVLLSDFLVPLDDLEKRLSYLRAGHHEVAVFQIIDPAELSFNFSEPMQFHDLESGREMYIDPAAVREQYQARIQAHLQGVSDICQKLGCDVARLTTDTPMERGLSDFLRTRTRILAAQRR